MPDISKIKLPSGNVYDIKDAIAREMISGGVSYDISWDGNSTPDVTKIPAGVTVTYEGNTYTGTLAADDAQAGAFYLVKSSTDPSSESLDIYDEYVPVGTTGSKTWEKIGDTKIDLSDVVTNVTLSKSTDVVLGEGTTFTNASSEVTFGGLNGHTSNVLGTATTFSFTNPTITVTPNTTYLGATATGTAVDADGTAAAITGFGAHSTDTFVKSVTAETNKKLVTTQIPNVTGNTTVTANKSTWTFTMGSGDASETLIIGGGNGSDVTATNTTLGTAITAATGATAATGSGDAIVTGVTIGQSAAAITALGTPTTADVLTGVKVTSQPTISLASNASTGTGRIQVATGISNATATNGAVNVSASSVSAIVSLPTATAAAQSITIGTGDKVTVLTNATSLDVTKGNA